MKSKKNYKRKQNKDAMINRLLFVTVFSIIASVILWFIFVGYLHTAYILAMPKVMIGIFIVSAVATAFFGWKVYQSQQKTKSKYFLYLVISGIFALSSLAIKYYILYAIYALWIIIALYLVFNFAYYIYKLNVK